MHPSRKISDLVALMAHLRSENGCSWDRAQNFASIAPHTIEEAYEVADAISRGSMNDLREELGDLLLQVVFHAQMADEQNVFSFDDVVEAISAKLIRRHPHIFGETKGLDPAQVALQWDEIKRSEKASRPALPSLLDEVKSGLNPMMRAQKLTKVASKVGFDWDHPSQVIEKIEEELGEVREALNQKDKQALQDEIGDLLFAVINLARKTDIDAEAALRSTNEKFRTRFMKIEKVMQEKGLPMDRQNLGEMEAIWQEAKDMPSNI